MKYIAFLRGINVGGKMTVSMSELKQTLEKEGFTNIQTILNSGNVVFETEGKDSVELRKQLEELLEKTFHSSIKVIIRNEDDIRRMIAKDPFQTVTITPTIRANVTFLAEFSRIKPEKTNGFRIVKQYDDAICTVLDIAKGEASPAMMASLEKTYGKNITTRAWNTLQRIGKLLH
jgi:uncharacterized protein (DUF1697 family)